MPTKNTLRLLLIAEVFLGIASVVANYAGESSLPEALRNFESDQVEDTAVSVFGPVLGFLILLLLVFVVAWIGLFMFWRPARLIYLVVTVVTLLVIPFFGPTVETGQSYSLGQAASIMAGVILALIYWSPLKELYEKQKTA